MQSQYANAVPNILAEMNEGKLEEENEQPADSNPQEGNRGKKKLFVYRTDQGGWLISPTKLEPEEEESPEGPAFPITDTQEQETDQRPLPPKEPPYFLHFLLLLLLFLVLDIGNSEFIALTTPTATITLTPDMRTMTLQSTAQLGKVLSPLTVTQAQTVPATGHGHQNAARAIGTVTFYNGLFTSQSIAAGTVFTGHAGVTVETMQPATIPPGNPSTGYGTATVPAQAIQEGEAGNITAGDITITIKNGLQVKNSQFRQGQDERDYLTVTKADRDTAAATLKAKVAASMTAALQGQLLPGQALHSLPCTPTVTANHVVGAEAQQLTVSVSETCTAVAYDSQQLTAQATQLLATQATKALGTGYTLSGDVQVSVTHATTHPNTPMVALTFTCQGTYAYLLNEQAQQRIKTLLAGKPRLTALHLLLQQRGIHTASIGGIADNQPLPDDRTHLHLLIVLTVF